MTNQVERSKEIARSFLTSKGWRRDGRCKKYETYKKTIGGEVYRMKFAIRGISFDLFSKPPQASRGHWIHYNYISYDDINPERPFRFLEEYSLSEEEIENNQYLGRIGAI